MCGDPCPRAAQAGVVARSVRSTRSVPGIAPRRSADRSRGRAQRASRCAADCSASRSTPACRTTSRPSFSCRRPPSCCEAMSQTSIAIGHCSLDQYSDLRAHGWIAGQHHAGGLTAKASSRAESFAELRERRRAFGCIELRHVTTKLIGRVNSQSRTVSNTWSLVQQTLKKQSA